MIAIHEDNGTRFVTVYGVITRNDVDIIAQAEASRGTDFNYVVYVSSLGGDLDAAFTLRNLLVERVNDGKTLDVHAIGSVASAATLLFTVENSRRIGHTGAVFAIHNAWTAVAGDAEELEETASILRKYDDEVVAAYSSVIARPVDEIRALVEDDSWFGPDEALSLGLLGELEGEESQDDADQVPYNLAKCLNATKTIQIKAQKETAQIKAALEKRVKELETERDQLSAKRCAETTEVVKLVSKIIDAVSYDDDKAVEEIVSAVGRSDYAAAANTKVNTSGYVMSYEERANRQTIWERAGLV